MKADADGNWKYSFSGLPKFKDGKEIKYSVTENMVEGYTTEINGFNITNSHKPNRPPVPSTGDGTGLTVFAAGLALAMVGFIGAIVARKKSERDSDAPNGK